MCATLYHSKTTCQKKHLNHGGIKSFAVLSSVEIFRGRDPTDAKKFKDWQADWKREAEQQEAGQTVAPWSRREWQIHFPQTNEDHPWTQIWNWNLTWVPSHCLSKYNQRHEGSCWCQREIRHSLGEWSQCQLCTFPTPGRQRHALWHQSLHRVCCLRPTVVEGQGNQGGIREKKRISAGNFVSPFFF